MIMRHSRGANRGAFTLIELMMVVAIIAILVSLVAAAVIRVMGTVPEVEASTDIAQLSNGLGAFMGDFNLSSPPPSVLILSESAPLSVGGQSASLLTKMFGKNLGATDWNGDGTLNGPWTLTGEQCLVFYLGGIPNTLQRTAGSPAQCLGFSYNKMNPAPISGQKTHGPYFTFQSSRLVPGVGGFYTYLDSWMVKAGAKPYAFFSSAGINNQYATSSGVGAAPYYTAVGQYTNPNTFQIISAGKDGAFGTTGWNPTSGAVGAGADDQANFSSGLLGTGQH